MSDAGEQFDQTEATEAKLCAYLEGQLPPAERAEIEEYLKGNPQHRNLLKELAATRHIVQTLPRENAPSEVAEGFTGQLERSLLLDGAKGEEAIVRINHRPQMLLAAAIVVLAVGLGFVVYTILPRPVQKYSVAPAAQPAPSVAVEPQPATPVAPAEEAAIPDAPSAGPLPSVAVATPSNVESNATEAHSSIATADAKLLDQPTQTRLRQVGIDHSMSTSRVLVVHTDDPTAAAKQLREYFAANNIQFQIAGEGGGASGGGFSNAPSSTLALNQPVNLKVMEQQMDAARSIASTQPAASGIDSGNLVNPTVLAKNEAQMSQNSPSNSSQQNPAGVADASNSNYSNNASTNLTKDAETTQPIAQAQVRDLDRQNSQTSPPAIAGGPNGFGLSAGTLNTSDKPVFIAKAMTRQDAVHLSSALSMEHPGQTTDLFFPELPKTSQLDSAAVAMPTTQPALMAVPTTLPTTEPTAATDQREIAVGDRLTVTVAQLVGPGVDKTNTVRVAENGTISLPMIEPVSAASQPSAELEKQIALKYREANLIPDATVMVNRAAATQPTETAASPTTQSADAEKWDVVVVLEKNPPMPVTMPTTEPAAPTSVPEPIPSQTK